MKHFDLTVLLRFSCRCLIKLFFPGGRFSLHGSYEGIAQALHRGAGATDLRAYRPLRRERATGGPDGARSRQDRAEGLEADGGDGGDREARGRNSGSPQRENRISDSDATEDVTCAAKGFTQHKNRKQRR